MAGIKTVLKNHGADMLDDPFSTWGVTEGNPLWEEISEAAAMVGETFVLNVTMNRKKEITGVFAGDLREAHRVGCSFVKRTAMVPVDELFDIVITSNSGYPLDLNLYQAVKGMSAASRIVRKGGAIIIAAECWDGIPEHGLYGQLLREAEGPEDLLKKIHSPGFLRHDQWQAQIQAQIQLKSDVWVYSHNLTHSQVESALLRKTNSIEKTVADLTRQKKGEVSICVLPEGPQTIPYIS